MTALEMIKTSFRKLGVTASGETLSADESTDGLSALNLMLKSWGIDGLLIPAKTREVFTLTPSDPTYTMGPTGNFVTSRPNKIENAAILDSSGSTPIEYPIDVITKDEWAEIQAKGIEGPIPTVLYPEGTYPNETLNLYPVPSEAHSLVMYSAKPLTQIATLQTAITLPDGYEEAIIYNLALRLAPEFGRAPADDVRQTAQDSLATIMRMNDRPVYARVDNALLPNQNVGNIFTGGS